MPNPISDNKANSDEFVFPDAVLDDCIVVYEAMYIERMLK